MKKRNRLGILERFGGRGTLLFVNSTWACRKKNIVHREGGVGILDTRSDNVHAHQKLAGVQAARGVAALMVVLYHTTRSLSLPQYLSYIPFGNIFCFGHAGVDFFFVLSGFIISHAHAADIGKPERLYRYIWRRTTRIYPIYLFVTLVELTRAVFSSDAATRLAPLHLLHSVLLLPESTEPLVAVAWTLRFEMLFYLVFALAIIDRRLGKPVVLIALLLVVVGVIVAPTDPWIDLPFSSFNIEFLMGIAAAKVLACRKVPKPVVLLLAGAFFFLTVGALEVLGVVPLNGLTGRVLYGSASVATLLGLVEAERRGTVRFGSVGVMLGNSSYCLYLIHLTIIPTAVRACANFGVLTTPPISITLFALITLTIVLAIALHLGVELPLANFIRRHTPRACR